MRTDRAAQLHKYASSRPLCYVLCRLICAGRRSSVRRLQHFLCCIRQTALLYSHAACCPLKAHVLSVFAVLVAQDEVSLYDNARERRQWDKLSEFFAIIKTTEHLENARIKSAIGRDEVRRRPITLPIISISRRDVSRCISRSMFITRCCLHL